MKIKNLSFNKKKIGSLILAMGICLCSKSGLGEIISFNQETTLKDGRNAKLYYITGTNSNDYAFVSFDNAVGFIPISEINYANLLINSEYQEITQKDCIRKNEAYLYQTPCMDNTKIICKLNKDSLMNIVAKWQDWYVVINEQNQTGFIHKSFLEEEKKQMEVAKVKGNNVNIRSSKTTKKNNIIGFADKTDTFKILSYDNDWYQIDYLGQTGYISSQYVER